MNDNWLQRIFGGLRRQQGLGNRPRRYRPNLESLEDRLTPVAVTSIATSINVIKDASAGSTLSLTVTYDTDMNQTIKPTISFPTANEDPTVAPITLKLKAADSTFTDAKHFVAIYDIVDANVDQPNIDVKVSGGQDTTAVVPAEFASMDLLDIDTKNPTVSAIRVRAGLITDRLVGKQTFKISVDFSESMDTTVKPTISFPVEKLGKSLVFVSGTWTDSNTYTASYTVHDLDVLINRIDLKVEGAKDVNGNAMAAFTKTDRFSLDTRNPKVVTFERVGFNASTGIMTFNLVFSQKVAGVNADDFKVNSQGLSGARIDAVSGSGDSYQISVFVGEGFGRIGLTLLDNGSIGSHGNGDALEGSSSADGGISTAQILLLRFHSFGFVFG